MKAKALDEFNRFQFLCKRSGAGPVPARRSHFVAHLCFLNDDQESSGDHWIS